MMNPFKIKTFFVKSARQLTAGALLCLLVLSAAAPGFAQMKISGAASRGKKSNKKATIGKSAAARKNSAAARVYNEDGAREAERMDVPAAGQKTVEEIMTVQEQFGDAKTTRQLLFERGLLREKEDDHRENIPDGEALPGSQYPLPSRDEKASENFAPQVAAQTLALQFNGATGPTETGAFPPDTTMGVGPTQVAVFVNGRLRTFNKTTGVADGVLNVNPDVFFSSVMSTPGAGEVAFTTDPNARYDRLTNRWFLNIIDVVLNSSTGVTPRVNRVIIAVSDAASNGNITASTVWTFYQFQGDATLFTDYQSFGIDASAMYIGANMFTLAGGFNSTKGFVIPKAPALTGSPLVVWSFPGLVATGTGAGPFSPRGVDNPDPANTGATATGYFVGVDNATFSTLIVRRVTNPGSLVVSPTISANLSVAVPTTRFPVLVPHLGNTAGNNGRLDALDDRLYAASMRNGRLWTAHSIGVNNTGVAGASNNRNAARWYELQNLATTPSLVQSGTLFDNNATNDANQRNYWIPSIAVSGQGHAVLGSSIAGTNERVNAFQTGRLAGDTLGTMREGPGGAAIPGYTASTFAYNPPGDPGGPSRRWGDYSIVVVDPLDDMTLWTIQEYANAANTYGVQVAKLLAPPPVTPSAASGPVPSNQTSVNVTITGTAPAGEGFYDPGANLAAPARAFNHISASVSGTGVVVNSVTYNSPTSVTLNLNTVGAAAGTRNVTITNPDGQSRTGNNLLTVSPTVSGIVSYGSDPMKVVPGVLLSGAGAPAVAGSTNLSGAYNLANFGAGAYTLTPTKTGDVNGINSLDATRIQQHLVGITTLSAAQLIAADTDGSGTVNSLDATRIQQSLVGISSANIIGQWKFSPVSRNYASIINNFASDNYLGILVGEVSGNWTPPAALAANSGDEKLSSAAAVGETVQPIQIAEQTELTRKESEQKMRSSSPESLGLNVAVSLPTSSLSKGFTATIPVTVGNIAGANIESFDFSVYYDPTVLQFIAPPISTNTGTLSQNCFVLANAAVAGRVIVSGSCPTAINSGSGALYNLKFSVIGNPNQTSPLSFTNPNTMITDFQFNNGSPGVTTTNGLFTVLSPTAAAAAVSGKVTTAQGRGVGNVTITMIDAQGKQRTTQTTTFGYYRFDNVQTGETVTISARSKRYQFDQPAIVRTINESITDADFIVR